MSKSYKKYIMKVSIKGNAKVSRTIQIYGGKTLDDLSTAILGAFDFDEDHLYMFSLKEKTYDPMGYYRDEGDFFWNPGHKSTSVKIDELGLKEKKKILYLYDFGDEWKFNITVKSITEEAAIPFTSVLEGSGKIEQYQYDEDYYDEYDYDEDFDDIKNPADYIRVKVSDKSIEELLKSNLDIDNLRVIAGLLNVNGPSNSATRKSYYAKVIAEKLREDGLSALKLLPPEAVLCLVMLVEGDINKVFNDDDMVNAVDCLEDLSFINRVYSGAGVTISIASEAVRIAKLFSGKKEKSMLKNNSKLYNNLLGLMHCYKIIEVEKLYEVLKKSVTYMTFPSHEELKSNYINVAMFWKEFGLCRHNESNEEFYSNIEAEMIGYVMAMRERSGIEEYKIFSPEDLDKISIPDATLYIPAYKDLERYLVDERRVTYDEFSVIFMNLEIACGIGMEEGVFIDVLGEAIRNLDMRFTKKFKNMLLKIREEYPCASLKGYSIKEYKVSKAIEGKQLSLFD